MPSLVTCGVRIHYEVHGQGSPVVLLHGGAVNFKFNYADCGWIEALTRSGFQVIGLDFRGHGNSAKPHDVASYGTAHLAGDVLAVVDHLALQRVSLVGYSMGTAVALHLMQGAQDRFERAVLLATGDGLIGHPPHTFSELLPALRNALNREEYPRDLPKHVAAYWNFVAATGGDKQALLALASASYPPISTTQAGAIATPALVVSGENDRVLGRGPRLARALGRGQYVEIPGADHFSLAVDAGVKAAVGAFLV